ncbi:hypothetical protein JYK02_25885 [Corallococcus macrosporus]|uniref:Lipoprotein n=1 Tax=Corallococcus macrosporus TaxID=35 RepID=A0ABS3DI05_9BACT|nr:hypothetical protein [Corallococcus macrosporus]MBN8230953.1 hypothetical protein [Corallococcus macrosporus]
MSRSFLAHTALSSAAVATLLLTGCDPICTDGVSRPGQGHVTRSASGTCVQLVVTHPDAGAEGPDAGTDAGTGGDLCGSTEHGWTTQVVEESIDTLISAFVFDAKGVGHYAFSKDAHLHVGTTRPGDVPTRVDSVWTFFDVNLAVGADGTHHVLFQYVNDTSYATDLGGTWTTRYLSPGWARAIALDAQDRPHVLIARLAPKGGYLLGTVSATGAWTLTPLDELGLDGDRERMAVDANGHVHIVFARLSGGTPKLVYASNASGAWVSEPLEQELPLGSPRLRVALEVDAAGRPSLLGSDDAGAWLLTKEDSGWKSYPLGAYRSRGPALARSATFPDLRHALLDDADVDANVNGSTSQLVVRTLHGTSPVGTTPPLVLETRDGGNALPGPSAVHVDDQDRIQVGFTYVHYDYPSDGGPAVMTRGMRYARYCP